MKIKFTWSGINWSYFFHKKPINVTYFEYLSRSLQKFVQLIKTIFVFVPKHWESERYRIYVFFPFKVLIKK
jgi:hypothetical protein